jgi:hypothetical protein
MFFHPEVLQEEPFYEEKRSRKATVYDAVAGTFDICPNQHSLILRIGRISAAGFIPKHLTISSTRDTPSSSTAAVAPESVLFRRKNAPTRYVESDIYFANTELKTDLPDSDVLKALHCYTTDFYAHATASDGVSDWRSMDESALLAMGILMEETARDTLGQTGDFVFTEGEEIRTVLQRVYDNSHGTATDKEHLQDMRKASKERASKKRRIMKAK